MNKLQAWLGPFPAKIALFLYLLVGLIQFLVIPAGIEVWFGLHWMVGAMGALILAWVPIVGQGAGLAAAVSALGWPVAAAAALFLWPVWLLAAVVVLRYFSARRRAGGGDSFDRRFGAIKDEFPVSRNSIDDTPPHARTDRPLQSV